MERESNNHINRSVDHTAGKSRRRASVDDRTDALLPSFWRCTHICQPSPSWWDADFLHVHDQLLISHTSFSFRSKRRSTSRLASRPLAKADGSIDDRGALSGGAARSAHRRLRPQVGHLRRRQSAMPRPARRE